MAGKTIKLKGISKNFNSISILKNINLDIEPGKIYALFGKNGAGKTTIVKILAGVYQADSGSILYGNQEVSIRSPKDARRLGWGFVLQDLGLFDNLTIAENIYFNNFPGEKGGILNKKSIISNAKKLCESVGFNLDVNTKVANIGMGQKHIVAFLRLIALKPQAMIIDELSSALTHEEIKHIFKVLNAAKKNGCPILYVTHNLSDIYKYVDNIVVIRDGEVIINDRIENVADSELFLGIAGADQRKRYPKLVVSRGPEVLRTENISIPGVLHDISFVLHRGEVLGIAGLVGSGRTALAKVLSGMLPNYMGDLYFNRKKIRLSSPKVAVKQGICLIPDDRVREGIFNVSDLKLNITIAHLDAIENPQIKFLIDHKQEKEIVTQYLDCLGVTYFSIDQQMRYLSSGNQQKVLIARWLLTNAAVFIMDEPTKELDVASKVEVYNLINELIRQNKAVIFISSDLSEIVGMCDRILVLA
ncbi:MAG: sugar ABC transporter ATP-binding protein, partial [Eubacteriales bacterium]